MLKLRFKKKTREQQMEKRVESVLAVLLGNAEFEFTDLERVQIVNNVRRGLADHLKMKQATYIELSVNNSQSAKEIGNALEYIE
jgi:hypothetical protein